MARNFGQNPVDLLRCKGIEIGEVEELNFLRACNTRLMKFDTDCKEADAKRIAREVRKIFFGSGESEEIEGGAVDW